MITIKGTTIKDIPAIQTLSNIVWPITFGEILSKEQIAYMMKMMYSTESLTEQMTKLGHHYVLACEDDQTLGYLSYQTNIDDKAETKVHKIYVLPSAQGKGVGKILIEYATNIAQQHNSKVLKLNVNRYNRAVGFYKNLGFEAAHTEDNDIGNGFLMEDYVMTKFL